MIRTAPSAGRATRVLVALVLAVPLLGACNVTGRHASQQETDGSTVSDITLTLYSGQEAQDVAAGKRSMTPLPTAGGVVHVDYIYSAVSDDPDATWVVGYAPGEETVQWAVEIAEGAWYRDVESSPQSSVIGRTENSSSGPQAVSPDGRHLSVLVQPSSMEDVDTVAEQRSLVVVLDAATGRTVRTVEISGLVLGQTLTDDTLAVQTAQDYFPAGDGQTAVTVYPLDFPDAEATSFPTDQWLVGAGGRLPPAVPVGASGARGPRPGLDHRHPHGDRRHRHGHHQRRGRRLSRWLGRAVRGPRRSRRRRHAAGARGLRTP